VYGGHQAALDAPVVVQHLGHGRQAVGGAGGCGNDGLARIGLVVDTVHEHRGAILGRRGHDDLLGTGIDVLLAGLFGQEEAGALQHQVDVDVAPGQVRRVALSGQADGLAVDNQVLAVDGDIALEVAVHGVVLEHVSQIVGIQQVVDTHDLDVVSEILRDRAEGHAADTAKTVNAYFDSHIDYSST